ncbi:MAG TPA: carboxypeptidase-like regulatory domain-containing protein, partial [Acidobacteriaceae bacterium]
MLERPGVRGLIAAAPLCVALCAGATVLATVRGVVHDPAHRPIAGAHVEIAAITSQYRAKLESDAEGAFEMSSLPVGEYRLTVTAPGFAPQQQ